MAERKRRHRWGPPDPRQPPDLYRETCLNECGTERWDMPVGRHGSYSREYRQGHYHFGVGCCPPCVPPSTQKDKP